MKNCNRWTGIGLLVLSLGGFAAGAGPVTAIVPSSLPAGQAVPVVLPIPDNLVGQAILTGRLNIDGRSAGEVTLQTEPADKIAGTPARAWFIWAAKPGQIGRPISIELKPAAEPTDKLACQVRYTDPQIKVAARDGKPILTYRHGEPDSALKYRMTSYIHPLVGLDGEILTDCSPGDHPHHRGLFWSWVRIVRNGQPIGETWIPRDFGLEPADISVTEGPVMGRFTARHYWLHSPHAESRPAGSDAERIFQEDLVCRVFDCGQGRAIDIDLTLTALQDGLEIGGQTQFNKGYGGMTLRFSTVQQGQAKQPRVVADGKQITEATLNHLKALWVDWTGVFNGPDGRPLPHRSGGALFVDRSHPPLPASPPEWITRFYGPIGVCYPGLAMLPVPRDKPMRLKYRIWIHRGDAAEGGVEGQYRAYAADWQWKSPE